MKKIILILVFALLGEVFLTSFEPPKTTYYTGYQYLLSTGRYTSFKYTRSYKESDDMFTTNYKLYNPETGVYMISIVGVHLKKDKKIIVKVTAADGGIFGDINEETTTYEAPTINPFGFAGSVKQLGGDNIPNQLKVKFVSNNFENINVMHIAGSHDGGEFEFFVLDEKK